MNREIYFQSSVSFFMFNFFRTIIVFGGQIRITGRSNEKNLI